MDPLSIAASIAGLVTLVAEVISKAAKYSSDLRDATKDLSDFVQELIYLKGVLSGLEAFLRVRATIASTPSLGLDGLAAPNGAIQDCQSALDAIMETLKKCERNPGSKRRKLSHKLGTKALLIWPLTKEATERHLRRIERLKCTFTLAISAENIQSIDTVANKINEIAKSLQSEQQVLQDERKKAIFSRILDWISSTEMSTHHEVIAQTKVSGTNEWFFGVKEFLQWSKLENGILWVHAPPGAGKTVLMSSLIDALKPTDTDINEGFAYFYCDNRDTAKRNPKSLIGSLIGQLCAKNLEFYKTIGTLFESKSKDASQRRLSIERLQNMLCSSLPAYTTLTIVVDALDECQDRTVMLDWLYNLAVREGSRVRLLISSRKEQDIAGVLKGVPEVHLNHLNMSQDIEAMLSTSIKRRQRDHATFLAHDDFRDQVTASIVDGANGNFQWAKCQFDNLCLLGTDDERAKFIDDLDLNLDKSYERVFISISSLSEWHAELAKWLLPWVSTSLRPLKYKELIEALALADPALYRLIKGSVGPKETLKMFRGLIQWDQTTDEVSFPHFSIKEYVLSSRIEGTPAENYRVDPSSGHADIAKVCIRYVLQSTQYGSYRDEEELQKALIKYPLLDYAAKSWIFHSQNAGIDAELDNCIMQLLTDGTKEEEQVEYTHFATWNQVEDYKKHGYSFFRTKVWGNPFTTAIETKRLTVLQALIDDGFHFRNDKYHMPLHWAASRGQNTLMELLLDNGADPNEADSHDQTALHVVLRENNLLAVKLLVERGANPHLVINTVQGSPFSHAVAYADIKTIKCLLDLLERGTIDLPGGMYGTALQRAASEGRRDVLEILIEHGADINKNLSEYGSSALHSAADSGHFSVVKYLVSKGAEINTLGSGGSPLQSAINFGKLDVALYLLRLPQTDCNLDTGVHGNALQQALVKGHSKIVTELLAHGAVGDSELGYCKSALEAAVSKPDNRTLSELLQRYPKTLNAGTNPSRILQRAIIADQLDVLCFLLQRNAELDVQDEYGWTPALCAIHMGNTKALAILEDHCNSRLKPIDVLIPRPPTRWNSEDSVGYDALSPEGMTINFEHLAPAGFFPHDEYSTFTFNADAPCWPCTWFYFEITILFKWTPCEDKSRLGNEIKIGLTRDEGILRIRECDFGSHGWIYVPDKSFINMENRQPFGIRDTVGCGYDWKNKIVFFTLNGALVDTVPNISRKLYPFLSISNDPVRIITNFGERSFMYQPANGGGALIDEDEAE